MLSLSAARRFRSDSYCAVDGGVRAKSLASALLSLLLLHLHLLCDLVSSPGPSPEDLWPIFYFGPFDKEPMWLWHGQWRLDVWRNPLFTAGLFELALWIAPARVFGCGSVQLPRGYGVRPGVAEMEDGTTGQTREAESS